MDAASRRRSFLWAAPALALILLGTAALLTRRPEPTPTRRAPPPGTLDSSETPREGTGAPADPLEPAYGPGIVTFTTRCGNLSVGLKEVRIGPYRVAPDPSAPRAAPLRKGGGVEYAHGTVVEKYVPRGKAVEQLFVLGPELAPLRGEGPLALTVSLVSSLTPALAGREEPAVEFRDASGAAALTYGRALAIDSAGRTRVLRYDLRPGELEMTLDAEFLSGAEFPLTIDPLIGTNFPIDATSGGRTGPDAAWSPGAGSYLVAFQQNTNNGDVYVRSVSATGAVDATKLAVETSVSFSAHPRVAASAGNQFLVVWDEKAQAGNPTEIRGQFVTVTGNVPALSGSPFVIIPADASEPDVGFCTAADKYLVVAQLKLTAQVNDIVARTVTPAGAVSATVTVDAAVAFKEKATVPQAFGNPVGVAWVHRANKTAQGDIKAASIDVSALTASAPAVVSAAAEDEYGPDLGNSGSGACFLVWAKQIAAADSDLLVRRASFPAAGPLFGPEATAVGGAAHTFAPRCDAVDSGGTQRMVVTYAQTPSFPPTNRAADVHCAVFDAAPDPPALIETFLVSSSTGMDLEDDEAPCVAIKKGALEALVAWQFQSGASLIDVWGQRVNLGSLPGFAVTPVSGLTTTEAGGTAAFTVRLTAAPTADVTFALSSSNTAEGTVSPGSLTFTPLNWNVMQTVTVTGANDVAADGGVAYTIVTAAATSGDGAYAGLNPADVSVTNLDDDAAGVLVSAVSGPTSEDGAAATFTIVLTSQPTADVTIPLASLTTSEGTVSPGSVVFTPSNWNSAQTVTVTGVNDAVSDGDTSYTIETGNPSSANAAYNALTAADVADVTVLNLDNEPEVTISASDAAAAEPGTDTGTFTVTRTGSTAAPLTVNFTVGGTATPGGDYASIGTSVTIPGGSLNAPIPLTPLDDAVQESAETVVVTLSPGTYTIKAPNAATVTIADNEGAGVTVSGISGPTTENGGTATFTLVLNVPPAADVAIPLASLATSEGTVSPGSVVFTPTNWNVPQTVTVTGANDLASDGDVPYTIETGDPTSIDSGYNALTAADVADVTVLNLDNEPEVTISASDAAAAEPGADTGTFTVTRTGSTATPLTVNFTVGGTATSGSDYASVGTSVTILAGSLTATVTLTPLDDGISEPPETAVITLAAGTYTVKAPVAATMTIADNDTAGIVVNPTSGLVTTESGGSASFTVVLLTTPTANVTLGLSSSVPTEGSPLTTSVTFTPANALVPQTVTVRGIDDTIIDGTVAYTILTTPLTSADPAYDGLVPPDVAASNTDNDAAGFVVAPTAGLVTTEAGGTATFTVALTSTPTAKVSFTLSSSDTGEGTVSPSTLVFFPDAALVPQTVTVTGVNDTVVDADIPYTIQTGPATSLDPAYSTLNPPDVAVTNNNDDAVGFTVTPSSGLFTNEGGTSATFTVALKATPSAAVTIPLSSSNTAEGNVSPGLLTFTSADALTPQTVTVTGVPDGVADGNAAYLAVLGLAASLDSSFDGLDPADVQVTNVDNEIPAITVEPLGGLTTSEAGATARFSVVLNTVPGGDVTLLLSSSNPAEGTVSPASLTFTPADALTPRAVTVTGVDDAAVDGTVAYQIVTQPAVSADPAYDGMDPANVSVTNADNDVVQPPAIGLSAIAFPFGANEGGANPPSQQLTLTDTGGQPLDWTAASSQTWLTLSATSGTLAPAASVSLSLSVDIAGLPPGTHNATVTLTGAGASNTPQTVSVSLTVIPPAPAVVIDTPTTAPADTTGSSPLFLGGTASNGPTRVTWVNARTGASGVAAGTGTWTASVPLAAGANEITVFGWNAGGVGTDTLLVTYAAETTAPAVTTSSTIYAAASSPFTLDGLASDGSGVSEVTWTNTTTGVRGTAAGTSAWSAMIPLTGGENRVAVAAADVLGNEGGVAVTILFSPPADLAPPSLSVTVPTDEPSYVSSVSPLTLGGTASDAAGVSAVSWVNDGTGGRGVASGTTSWTAAVGLASGGNVIRVTAFDASGNSSTAVLFVSFRPPAGDAIPPYLSIASPAAGTSFLTGSATFALGGLTADDAGVAAVTWSNAATGETGSAAGSAAWTAGVPLKPGPNAVRVTAYDTNGNRTELLISIEYQAPSDDVAAGNCGSVGADVAGPLLVLWLWRRRPRALPKKL